MSALSKGHLFLFRATTCHCLDRDRYQHCKQRKHAFGMVWLGFFCYEMLWIDLVCLVLVLFGLVWYDKIKFRATTCHYFNRDWYQHCKQCKHGLTCFWLGLFWYEILWIDFMSDNMRGTRQIHSLCMLLKISLLQTGLQVDFGMCLQDIKGHDSGSTYLDIHHNSQFHHPHNCQIDIRFRMFSPL